MKTKEMTYVAISAVLITICSWISIPMTVPFTLQTFAIFLIVGIFGGRLGTMAVALYLLMGAVGLPVFANFSGGLGRLIGSTSGGYLFGFLLTTLVMWGMEKVFGKKTPVFVISAVIGLFLCYLVGTLWFMMVYMRTTGPVGLLSILGWCVFPFVIPDLIKLGLATALSRRLSKALGNELKLRTAR